MTEHARTETSALTIPGRFREQAVRHAGRIAVRWDGLGVTYHELHERSRRVAALVRAHLPGGPGAVALLVPQGIEQIAAILGVLEAGAWYVPLDPEAPADGLRSTLARAEARLVLATGRCHDRAMAAAGDVPIAAVDRDAALPPPLESPPPPDPDAVAYVYFTSGTTGAPKGVLDTHRNVLDNVARYTRALPWTHEDRLTLLQASHFSGAVSNVFGALLNGAALLPYDLHRDGAGAPLASWLVREAPTIWHSVPSLFRSICLPGRVYPSVRVVRLEGDGAAPADVARFNRHFGAHAVLAHGLGATETGLSCQHLVRHGEAAPEGPLPVGLPLPGMDVRIVDESGAPRPPGEVGELVVRSRHLSPGYWRDPERTAQKFREVPGASGCREYRTGDLARMREDGRIEWLGRQDHQLKVRGHWVDVAAVESALAALPGVAEAAVTLVHGDDDEPRLVGCLVLAAGAEPSAAALRRELARRLPPHAVPVELRVLPALPLGAHGKLDRRALVAVPSARLHAGGESAAPRDPREAALAAIWCDVLGLDRVGVRDRFVELGGDSLRAVRVALEIERRFGVQVPHAVLAELATIESLAARLGGGEVDRAGTLVHVQPGDGRPPLVAVPDLESDAFLFTPLARRLGPAQPVIVPGQPLHRPLAGVPRTIGALAALHLEALRAHGVRAPWQLAGFCYGAVVALEMARQLAARGERVSLLACLNVTAFDFRSLVAPAARRRFERDWGARLAYLRRKRGRAAWIARRLAWTAEDLAWRMRLASPLAPPDGAVVPAAARARLRAAFRAYRPAPHDGPVALFLADETLPLYADDPHEAWSGLATGSIEIHRLPHDGNAMLVEPDVERVAEVLCGSLAGPAADP